MVRLESTQNVNCFPFCPQVLALARQWKQNDLQVWVQSSLSWLQDPVSTGTKSRVHLNARKDYFCGQFQLLIIIITFNIIIYDLFMKTRPFHTKQSLHVLLCVSLDCVEQRAMDRYGTITTRSAEMDSTSLWVVSCRHFAGQIPFLLQRQWLHINRKMWCCAIRAQIFLTWLFYTQTTGIASCPGVEYLFGWDLE